MKVKIPIGKLLSCHLPNPDTGFINDRCGKTSVWSLQCLGSVHFLTLLPKKNKVYFFAIYVSPLFIGHPVHRNMTPMPYLMIQIRSSMLIFAMFIFKAWNKIKYVNYTSHHTFLTISFVKHFLCMLYKLSIKKCFTVL